VAHLDDQLRAALEVETLDEGDRVAGDGGNARQLLWEGLVHDDVSIEKAVAVDEQRAEHDEDDDDDAHACDAEKEISHDRRV
jgi:hypothetical protein